MRNVSHLNNIFDAQIRKEVEETENDKPISYYHKMLFNLTLNFTIDDWRNIRDAKYWELKDSIKGETGKLKFTIGYIKNIMNLNKDNI